MSNTLTEILEACELYKTNTNEKPRIIVLPVPRARALVADLIKIQRNNSPRELLTASVILDDREFADFISGQTLVGMRVMVLTDHLILGGWAEPQLVNR